MDRCSVGRGLDARLQSVGAVMGPSLFSIRKMPQYIHQYRRDQLIRGGLHGVNSTQ